MAFYSPVDVGVESVCVFMKMAFVTQHTQLLSNDPFYFITLVNYEFCGQLY